MSIASRVKDLLSAQPPAPADTVGSNVFPRTITVSEGGRDYKFVCHSVKEQNRAQRMLEKEKGTIAWLDRELKPDDIFFDIGANIGVYTIFAADRINGTGAIFAFEPHIPNANSLIENIVANRKQHLIKLVTAALSNQQTYQPFNYQSLAAASSTSQLGRTHYEQETFEPVFVEIKHGCSIDELWQKGVIPAPDLVKIDVDGVDFEVLDGMRNLLTSDQRPRSIQVELGSDSKLKIMNLCDETGYMLQEKHWTKAGLDFIAAGNSAEDYPHYGIFRHLDQK